VKLWECICHSICIWLVFCLSRALVFCHNINDPTKTTPQINS
jgi:hypothetical protein